MPLEMVVEVESLGKGYAVAFTFSWNGRKHYCFELTGTEYAKHWSGR